MSEWFPLDTNNDVALSLVAKVWGEDTMSLRSKWEFEYTAQKLAVAAEEQRAFRSERIVFWEGKKKEVMERIKAEGLTIDESIADGLSVSNMKYGTTSHDRGATVMVDQTMQRDLDECVNKIRKHTDFRNQYAAWQQLLSANPEARVKLDHDDWQFFFGKA